MITVLMATNGFNDYLKLALQSIISQTFTEFEIVLVANGPQCNEVEAFVRSNFPDESRLKLVKSIIPQLSYALNLGIDHAKYEYIARMDADDIAHPERLERQLAYLLEHDLDVLGTAVNIIDSSGKLTGFRSVPEKNSINKSLPFKNAFVHPSTMIRKAALIKVRGYNAGFNSEDYDLWLRLKRLGVKWDNMPDALLDYRVHPAATQGRLLGYAETSGAMLREFLLSKTPINALSVVISILKTLFKARN